MIKLCGTRDYRGRGLYWYYNLSDNKVYCVELRGDEKAQVKMMPLLAMAGVGPVATFLGILFGDITVMIDKMLIVLFVLSLVLGIICIFILCYRAQKAEDALVLNNSVGELKSKREVLRLFKAGKNYRAAIIFFIALGFILMAGAVHMFQVEQSAIGILIFYIGAYSATFFVKMLSPVKLIQVRLRLSKVEQ